MVATPAPAPKPSKGASSGFGAALGGLFGVGGNFVPDLSGGDAAPSSSGPAHAAVGGTFNISPGGGVNLGELINEYSNPPQNGGAGLALSSPLFPTSTSNVRAAGGGSLPIILLLIAGTAGAIFFLGRR